MTTLTEFAAGFDDEPGYLNFASIGPPGRRVLAEQRSLTERLATARFGSFELLFDQDLRMRRAVASLIGFRDDQVVFQPNTSTGLMQAMFGISGGRNVGSGGQVSMAASEYPSITFAATRAAQAFGGQPPQFVATAWGRMTPGDLRDGLPESCTAVVVSLVDFRSGFLADLDGIRQVIGDRLLIVDAIQGFGVVDAPWALADVVVSGGQKWVRAGWGTGFLALSDRALERLTPVLSGANATEADLPLDGVLDPRSDAGAFTMSYPGPIAQAMFATALEDIAEVGVASIAARVVERAGAVIEIADRFGVPVISPRATAERAGIVVLRPEDDRVAALSASLMNHGISATLRQGAVRLSAHVTTGDDTLDMLGVALTEFRAGR